MSNFFVKCIDNTGYEKYITKGKIYEVIVDEGFDCYMIIDDNQNVSEWGKEKFKEVKQEEQNKFRFITKSEIIEVSVDGIEGILIKTN